MVLPSKPMRNLSYPYAFTNAIVMARAELWSSSHMNARKYKSSCGIMPVQEIIGVRNGREDDNDGR